jgi:ATP phosphoribosyltransferase regulatory subunit
MRYVLENHFGRGELVALRLRRLFEQRGFLRVHVAKFEDYALYVENKNFLQSESVITFMDPMGRLMALKPDVTLSIVKNMPKKPPAVPEKLYYVDEVYRLSRESREYKVHSQIGVEAIGDTQGFGSVEVLDLALESLRLIGPRFVLDMSHLGFVSGLLAGCAPDPRDERRMLECIHQKNAYDLGCLLERMGTPEEQKNRVLALCGLHGDFGVVLEKAKGLIQNDQMRESWEELRQVGGAIAGGGDGASCSLDFSAVNDLDYYNGLIFRGYVQDIPRVVLTGGRYDNLMHKMGKQSGAIGFAVSLDELSAARGEETGPDFDILLLYEPESDYRALLAAIKTLGAQGKTVRAERADCDLSGAGPSYARVLRFENGTLKGEGEPC